MQSVSKRGQGFGSKNPKLSLTPCEARPFASYCFVKIELMLKMWFSGSTPEARIRSSSKMKKYLSVILAILIIVAAGVYVSKHFDDVRDILSISFESLLILLSLALTEILLNGYSVRILLRSFGVKLSFHEWFGLSSVTTMANFLLPFRGGMGIRAMYLKSKFDFPLTSFLSTIAASYVIHLLIRSFIGMVSFILLYMYYDIFSVPIFILIAAVFGTLMSLVFIAARLPKLKNKYLARINDIVRGWQIITGNKKLLIELTVLFLSFSFVAILIIYFSFKALSINLTVLQSCVISCLNFLVSLLSVTPGAIGLSEAVIAFSSNLFGVILTQAIIAAALRRSIILLVVFILGPIYSFALIGKEVSTQKG